MAVPARIDGEGEGEENEGLFEEVEVGVEDLDSDVPSHLRALADAAQCGNVNALRIALDNHSGSIDDPVEDGNTLMHLCCLYGYFPCVHLLVERGASLESKDEEAGDVNFVKRMLGTADAEGNTPLHRAARGEHLDVVSLLLSAGASPKTINVYGKTPAELAEPNTPIRSMLEVAAAAAATESVACQ